MMTHSQALGSYLHKCGCWVGTCKWFTNLSPPTLSLSFVFVTLCDIKLPSLFRLLKTAAGFPSSSGEQQCMHQVRMVSTDTGHSSDHWIFVVSLNTVVSSYHLYYSLAKEHPWAENLTSLLDRRVCTLLSVSHLSMKEHSCHVYSDLMPSRQKTGQTHWSRQPSKSSPDGTTTLWMATCHCEHGAH